MNTCATATPTVTPGPGRLSASGILFLRAAPTTALSSPAADADTLVYLPLMERWRPPGADHDATARIDAWWRGAAALSFIRAHGPHLRAGTPLHLTLTALRPHVGRDNSPVLAAEVYACSLAPTASQARDAERAQTVAA